jgi:hypothetical protein
MKAFLWSRSDDIQGGKCLVAWSRVQSPTHLGGLGVFNLKLMGVALRLRWLWLHRTDNSRSWSALPIQVDHTTQALFKASVKCVLGDGKSILFWSDPWLDGESIIDSMPELGAVVPAKRQCTRTVSSALHQNGWIRDILGPLTVPVLIQYLSLREKLQDVNLDHNIPDWLLWRWCPSGRYSSKSAYLAMFHGQTGVPGANEAWKIRTPNEFQFFIWLAVQNRCWTSERLHRHGMRSDSTCALCNQ